MKTIFLRGILLFVIFAILLTGLSACKPTPSSQIRVNEIKLTLTKPDGTTPLRFFIAMAPDGRMVSIKKGFTCDKVETFPVSLNNYLAIWSGTIDLAIYRALGMRGEPNVSVMELRDNHHRVLWRRPILGSVWKFGDSTPNELAVLVTETEAGSGQTYIDISSHLFIFDAKGVPKYIGTVPVSTGDGPSMAVGHSGRYMFTYNWPKSDRCFVVNQQSKIIQTALVPPGSKYEGMYNGSFLFTHERALGGPIGNLKTPINKAVMLEMIEIDGHGRPLPPITIKLKYPQFGSQICYDNGKLVLLICMRDGSLVKIPWRQSSIVQLAKYPGERISFMQMTGYPVLTAKYKVRWSHTDTTFSRTDNISELMYLGGGRDQAIKVAPLLRYRARDDQEDGVWSIQYGSSDVIIMVPVSSRVHRLMIVNRNGKVVEDTKVSTHNYWSSFVLNDSFMMSEDDDLTIRTIGLTIRPLISTTPTADGMRVRITCATKGASIRYSVDTRDPDSKGQSYRGEFTVPKGSTITARATAPRSLPSQIGEMVGK